MVINEDITKIREERFDIPIKKLLQIFEAVFYKH